MVQISDKADIPVELAEELLMGLIDDGMIVSHIVRAPNGKAATAYTVAGVSMPTLYESQMASVATEEAAGEPMTYGDRAVQFITANGGSASSDELHKELGLKAGYFVSTYLSSAVKNGQVNKDGKLWKLGRGSEVKPAVHANGITVVPKKDTKVAGFAKKISDGLAKPNDVEKDTKISWIPAPTAAQSVAPAPVVTKNPVPYDAPPAQDVYVTVDFVPEPSPAPVSSPADELNGTLGRTEQYEEQYFHATNENKVAGVLMHCNTFGDFDDIEIVEDKITFGLWSNGELHIAHDGVLLLKFSRAKLSEMMDYLDTHRARMAGL